jgi:hypothetical protein
LAQTLNIQRMRWQHTSPVSIPDKVKLFISPPNPPHCLLTHTTFCSILTALSHYTSTYLSLPLTPHIACWPTQPPSKPHITCWPTKTSVQILPLSTTTPVRIYLSL